MAKNNAQEYPGRNAKFSELLRWHMNNGTSILIPQLDKWPYNLFADTVGVHPQTVYNWLTDKRLPSIVNYKKIEDILFGSNPELSIFRRDLLHAYQESENQIRQIDEPKPLDIRYRDARPSRISRQVALMGMDGLRFISNSVPISSDHTILSLSINIEKISNKLGPLENLVGIENYNNSFDLAEGIEDFITHIINDAGANESKILDDVMSSIDKDNAIIYFGSIKSAKTNQIAKLPNLIKSFSNMSNRQFRVGLFRLSTTVVVITVISGSGAALGWSVTSKLKDIASKAIIELSKN